MEEQIYDIYKSGEIKMIFLMVVAAILVILALLVFLYIFVPSFISPMFGTYCYRGTAISKVPKGKYYPNGCWAITWRPGDDSGYLMGATGFESKESAKIHVDEWHDSVGWNNYYTAH